ncbi:hypothetical protein PTKIN_Ptkin18bG0042000 [Pterospermum kingtungense]
MATAFSSSSPSPHHNFFTYSNSKTLYSDSLQPLIYSPLHPHRPSLPIRLRSRRLPRCLSAGPGPPSQPDSDPPPSPVNATDQEFLLPQSDTIEGVCRKVVQLSRSYADLLCCSFLDVSVLLVLCLEWEEFW